MASRKKRDNPKHVTVEDCEKKHARIEMALFGPDGRGGIVADLADIKSKLSVVRTVGLPILIAVASALITAWILGKI